jgi:hypothetical protein
MQPVPIPIAKGNNAIMAPKAVINFGLKRVELHRLAIAFLFELINVSLNCK